MQTTANNPLANLRDIHLPPAISIWPPAPGWFVLAGVMLLIAAGIVYYFLRRWMRNKPKRIAYKRLCELQKNYIADRQSTKALADINEILKRVVLVYYPKTESAALHGEAWLSFLDTCSRKSNFRQHGRLLITGPYQSSLDADLEQIFVICKQWVKSVKYV